MLIIDRKYLPIWSLFHVLAVIFLASLIGTHANQIYAYFSVFIIYWISCWITVLVFKTKLPVRRNTREKIPFLNYLSFLPTLIIVFVVFSKSYELPTVFYAVMIVCVALINGFTEEMYWRRMYINKFPEDVARGLVWPWFMFTVWHFALLCVPGVVYEGGVIALIGGASFLGGLWGICYWFNRNFFVIATAHVLINAFAFFALARDNSWI